MPNAWQKKLMQQVREGKPIPKYHSGGKVKKTGLAMLKKNEIVLSVPQANAYKKAVKKKKKGGK